jgi:transcriptional regulator with XRE-family HTH domain
MNGIVFGRELRNLRNKSGKTAKELSRMIGKGDAYVSQLESGKIKKPDYETCSLLLQKLGLDESRIEEILDRFNIKSTERIQEEFKNTVQLNYFSNSNRNIVYDTAFFIDWYKELSDELKQANARIHHTFDLLIERDFSTAQKVINNLDTFTSNIDDLYFFCLLMSNDYSKLRPEKREELIGTISDFMANAI